MIAKGNLHGHGGRLIRYLLTGQNGERAELVSARGFEKFGTDLVDAAAVMQRLADETTRCEYAWFHVQTRLAPGEQLTRKQWEQVFDREEKRLHYTGFARVCSFHVNEQTGEIHGHAAWFRLDPETGQARDPGLFKLRLNEVARTAEIDFGLRQLDSHRQPHDRAPAPERKEMEESRRLGMDVRAIRTAILDCLEHSDSGKSFKAALDEKGLMLANGDRRDCFVVIDQEGGHHALNKKLTGMTLAALRERLADLDRSQLPSVEQAQDIQRGRQQERQAERETAPDLAPTPPEAAFAAAARQTTEPAAPIWDRDAANRAADEQIINAAIAATQEARPPAEPAGGMEKHGAGVEAVQPPLAAQETTSPRDPGPTVSREASELAAATEATAEAGLHAVGGFGTGLAKIAERALAGLFSLFGFGEVKDTPQQAELKARAAEERAAERAFEQAAARQQAEHEFLLREIERSRQSADQTPTAAELWGTPKPQTQREREKEQERDRGLEL